jgi:Protein of unknown function (DUF3306)
VDEGTRRAALRKLFADPHFNQMDGLDTYIDDYSQPDPIPAAVLAGITALKNMVLADPPPLAREETERATQELEGVTESEGLDGAEVAAVQDPVADAALDAATPNAVVAIEAAHPGATTPAAQQPVAEERRNES